MHINHAYIIKNKLNNPQWHPNPKNSTITRIEKIPKTLTVTLTQTHDQINMLIIEYTNSIDFWVGCHKELLTPILYIKKATYRFIIFSPQKKSFDYFYHATFIQNTL